MNSSKRNILIGGALLSLAGVALVRMQTSIPKGAVAVKPFNSKRYLGKWYEIARLDYYFEKHLSNVTANYSIRDDGMIKVDNRGFNDKKGKWEEVVGKAKFVNSETEGRLKVSFFGPFYSGYNVIALDPEYRYALVAGKNLSYLWLLSRETSMPEAIKTEYLHLAKSLGYAIDKLVWVEHNEQE